MDPTWIGLFLVWNFFSDSCCVKMPVIMPSEVSYSSILFYLYSAKSQEQLPQAVLHCKVIIQRKP